jgi:hypothetical protein
MTLPLNPYARSVVARPWHEGKGNALVNPMGSLCIMAPHIN